MTSDITSNVRVLVVLSLLGLSLYSYFIAMEFDYRNCDNTENEFGYFVCTYIDVFMLISFVSFITSLVIVVYSWIQLFEKKHSNYQKELHDTK